MCASSSSASSRFWSCTRLRVTWYLRRITVRQSRCSASGTKLKVSSCATRRFTNRSASGKSLLRPPGPRFDCAWARWSVPASRGALSRARRWGRQCCSRASHTGRQVLRGRLHHDLFDLVFDQPVGQTTEVDRRRADLLTLELEVAVDFDVGHRDGQHLLVDVYSRDPVRHRPLLLGAESVPCRINQGRELSPRENTATLNYSVNHARSGSNSCSASLAPWLISTSPLPARPFCTRHDFHVLSRASGPSCNQLRKSSHKGIRRWQWQRVRGFGHSKPAEALAKAELARKIGTIIERRGLTQSAAAALLEVDQPKISALISRAAGQPNVMP